MPMPQTTVILCYILVGIIIHANPNPKNLVNKLLAFLKAHLYKICY